jgi:sugar phosphate isomerase/epimerase
MSLRERIGVEVSRRLKLEDAIEWAAKNGVRFIDIQLDTADNALTTFDAKRCRAVRARLDKHDIRLGLHTLSAVNVAEYSPHVSDAATEYLKSYVNIYPKLGASWIVVHAGYHFTTPMRSDRSMTCSPGATISWTRPARRA